jgi:hypothetical protein
MEISPTPNPKISSKAKPALLDEKKWLSLIAEWENGDESQREFCERLQINLHTFSYMRSQTLAKKNRPENKFIAVKVKEEILGSHSQNNVLLMLIESNNGIKIHISLDTADIKILHILKLIGWHHD